MAYHISIERSVTCEECLHVFVLLCSSDKSAKKEAEEEGWKHKKNGWICSDCLQQNTEKEV